MTPEWLSSALSTQPANVRNCCATGHQGFISTPSTKRIRRSVFCRISVWLRTEETRMLLQTTQRTHKRWHMKRDEALALLKEYTKSESLIKHALAVEAAMRLYASRFGESAEFWGLTGLIHDFDYERWPNPPDHTREGARILRERGVDGRIVGAILSHADWNWD